MTVKQAYLAELAAKGFQSDPAQLRAVDALQRCADDWAAYKAQRSNAIKKLINRPDVPRGVYMYGGVGRGKSFLMECFFNAVPLKRKVRLRVSAHALKSVEHRGGLDAYLLKAREEELSDRCRRLRREVRKARETAAAA